jgi:hypothetical protein
MLHGRSGGGTPRLGGIVRHSNMWLEATTFDSTATQEAVNRS